MYCTGKYIITALSSSGSLRSEQVVARSAYTTLMLTDGEANSFEQKSIRPVSINSSVGEYSQTCLTLEGIYWPTERSIEFAAAFDPANNLSEPLSASIALYDAEIEKIDITL